MLLFPFFLPEGNLLDFLEKREILKKSSFKNFILYICFSKLTSETYSSYELIPAGHWLYDAYFVLMAQEKKTSLMDCANTVNTRFHFFLFITFNFLPFCGNNVERKTKKSNSNTDTKNSIAGVFEYIK